MHIVYIFYFIFDHLTHPNNFFVYRVKDVIVLWAWSVLLEYEETCATERSEFFSYIEYLNLTE